MQQAWRFRLAHRPSCCLGHRFLSHEFLTPLHDSHPDDYDAEGAEEQHAIAGNGNPMQVYGRYVLRNHQRTKKLSMPVSANPHAASLKILMPAHRRARPHPNMAEPMDATYRKAK